MDKTEQNKTYLTADYELYSQESVDNLKKMIKLSEGCHLLSEMFDPVDVTWKISVVTEMS